jgi:molybdenum cofactor guanylyltransferase
MAAPLYGLILLGGKSSRMGKDKAQLIFREGIPEWQRLKSLLEQVCEKTFLCHQLHQDFAQEAIIDQGKGPLAAIATAQNAFPSVAWLVLACDTPLVDLVLLQHLVANRKADRSATCYLSASDAQPEPLCAIYEPVLAEEIKTRLENHQDCPRDCFSAAQHLTLPNKNALYNANSPADVIEIRQILENSQSKKEIRLQYFGQLKELTGTSGEFHHTLFATASGVYEEIRGKYGFPFKQKQLMLAINDEFCSWDTKLKPNDCLVFIPPVAGG